MNLAPFFRQQFSDDNGNPLAGGTIDTYVAGTTTRLASYTDSSGVTPNSNPITLNSAGACDMWLDPTLTYKFVLKDSGGVTVKTIDNVAGSASGGIPSWNANTTYVKGNLVSDGTSAGLLYVSRTDANLNNALTSVTNWALYPGGIQRAVALTADTTLAVSDHMGLVRSNSTAAARTHTLPVIATSPIGLTITVKDIGSGGFTTSVKGSGTDTIDGAVTWATALKQNDAATFRLNGTSWDVI